MIAHNNAVRPRLIDEITRMHMVGHHDILLALRVKGAQKSLPQLRGWYDYRHICLFGLARRLHFFLAMMLRVVSSDKEAQQMPIGCLQEVD